MKKRAPMNAERRNSGAASRSLEDDPADSDRNWIVGTPRLWLLAFVLFVLGGMVLWGIEKETEQIDFRLLVSALRATSPASLAVALAATALSYLGLVGYDVSGLRYARAHAPSKTILLASFCGFAIGNSIGLPAGPYDIDFIQLPGSCRAKIVRVILFISVAFGVGLVTIAALGLVVDIKEASRLLGRTVTCNCADRSCPGSRILALLRPAANALAPRTDRHRCPRHNTGTGSGSGYGCRRARRRRAPVRSDHRGNRSGAAYRHWTATSRGGPRAHRRQELPPL